MKVRQHDYLYQRQAFTGPRGLDLEVGDLGVTGGYQAVSANYHWLPTPR